MKKFLIGLIFMLALGAAIPLVTNAQTCSPRKSNVSGNYYNTGNYYKRNQRSRNIFKNRNVRNIGLATGGGAIIGGLLGGNRKGMLKGAIVGAGAGALYTYIIRPKRN